MTSWQLPFLSFSMSHVTKSGPGASGSQTLVVGPLWLQGGRGRAQREGEGPDGVGGARRDGRGREELGDAGPGARPTEQPWVKDTEGRGTKGWARRREGRREPAN